MLYQLTVSNPQLKVKKIEIEGDGHGWQKIPRRM